VRSARLFGLALIVTPHVIGVPPVTEAAAALPDQLARNFAIGSLAISLIMWSVIGVITEVLMRRTALAGTAATTAPNAGA
jgi:predicted cobalt transporter CbtA